MNFFKKHTRKEIEEIESCYTLAKNSSLEKAFDEIIHIEAERVLRPNSRALYRHGEKEITVEKYVQLTIDPDTLFIDSNVYFRLFFVIAEESNRPIRTDRDLAYLGGNMKRIFVKGVNTRNKHFEKFGSMESINYINKPKKDFYLNMIDHYGPKKLASLYYLYTIGIEKGYPDLIGKNFVYEVKSVNDKLHQNQVQFNSFYKEYLGYKTRLVEVDDANKNSPDYILFLSTSKKERQRQLRNNRALRELFDFPLRLSQLKGCSNITPKTCLTDLSHDREFYLNFLTKEVKQHCTEDIFDEVFSNIVKELNRYYEMKTKSEASEIAEPILEQYRYALKHYNKNIKSLTPNCVTPLLNVLSKIELSLDFYREHYFLQVLVIVDKLSIYYKKTGDKDECNRLCRWILIMPEAKEYVNYPAYKRITSRRYWSEK